MSLLFDPLHVKYVFHSNEEMKKWKDLFVNVIDRSSKWGDTLNCNHDEDLAKLIKIWEDAFEDDDNVIIKENKTRTKKFLRSLLTIPYKKNTIRKYSSKSIEVALERVAGEQEKITDQLKKEKQKAKPDDSIIKKLEKLKVISDSEVENLYKEKNQQELEEASEKDWSERIKDTFELLRGCTTDLEKEYEKADTEYHLFLYGLIIPSIILLIWLCKLYSFIISSQTPISDWMCFLPYYLPVPIFIALFWLLIVQKNRAGKISIALSERLYQIKYLEGLLMTINRLSSNSQDAIETISKSLDKMVNAFLNKVSKEPMDELRIEAIEKNELNEDSYLKIIDKLTDLIKK